MEQSRFRDEWIAKAVKHLGIPDDVVQGLRKAGEPALAGGLLRMGVCTWDQLAGAVTETFQIPCVNLTAKEVEKAALSRLPQAVCEKFHLIPLNLNNKAIAVAMADPLDPGVREHISQITAREVDARYALPDRIEALVAECYSDDMMVVDFIEQLDVKVGLEILDASGELDRSLEAAGTMERFVNDLITKAVAMDASEIQLEMGRTAGEIFFVLDGVRRTVLVLPKALAEGPVTTRLKAMAGLDISEHLRPQEGRVKLRAAGRQVGLRVFTFPGAKGERFTVRVLDERIAALPFDKLGFRPEVVTRLEKLTKSVPGALLVSGPAGSGKTTLLYALLNSLKGDDRRLTTVEDPIEFVLGGVAQTQVDEKSGLNYPTALRAALRGNPQVVLLGDLRDGETASLALQAVSAGRRVLAALHTEDVFSALTRIADMGLPPAQVAAQLAGVVSQRLVRRLCTACRKPADPSQVDPAVASALSAEGMSKDISRVSSCEACNYTGYRGRLALIEILEMTDDLREKWVAGATEGELRQAAIDSGAWETLHRDALWHLSAGDTPFSEVKGFLDLERFRVVAPAPPTAPESPAAPESPVAPSARRILVTDDDALIRAIVRKALETNGYVVEEASDGFQALAQVAQNLPDLLVLDLDMPGMDGYGVLRMIRKRMALGRLPIVMLTSREDDESQQQAIELGADDYVLKPVKPGILLARIGAVFRRAQIVS